MKKLNLSKIKRERQKSKRKKNITQGRWQRDMFKKNKANKIYIRLKTFKSTQNYPPNKHTHTNKSEKASYLLRQIL